MRIVTNICIIAIITAFSACNDKSRDTQETQKTRIENIEKMEGKVIEFPDTINSMVNYSAKLNDIYTEKNIKIINFTDGRCPACIERLNGLNQVSKELDTIAGTDINLISFVLIENKKQFMGNIYPELDCLPLILVDNYRFLEKNKLPVSGIYHTFLVNTDNEVELVGNPYQNKELKQLYIEKIKSLAENNKNHTAQSSIETKIIEKTKEKFKEENKQVIQLVSPDGRKTGIFHLDNTTVEPMIFKKGRKLNFSLMNAKSNQEPVTLKIMDNSGETIKEVDSKLNQITYFFLQPKKTGKHTLKAHFENKKGKAVLFYYLVQ